MALVSMRELLDYAAAHNYGIPAFNVNNLEQVQAIMAAQASRQQRRAIADHVLTNAGPIDELARQVRSLHGRLIQP